MANRNFRYQNNHQKRNNFREKPIEGLTVTVRGDSPMDFQKALRKFKRKIADSGILKEIKERQYYTKPSDKRREAKKRAVARMRKQRAMDDMDLGNSRKRR